VIQKLGGRVFVKSRRSGKDVKGGLSPKKTAEEVLEVVENSQRI
jgi:hypothetical protein